MQIFVAGFGGEVTEQHLDEWFSFYGPVKSTRLVRDFNTGESRRFAFVQMSDSVSATAAIDGLGGAMLQGRRLRVEACRGLR